MGIITWSTDIIQGAGFEFFTFFFWIRIFRMDGNTCEQCWKLFLTLWGRAFYFSIVARPSDMSNSLMAGISMASDVNPYARQTHRQTLNDSPSKYAVMA